MSLSSAATLISPHTGRLPSTGPTPGNGPPQRKGSTHSTHHSHHGLKRRASSHAHSHGHGHTSSAGSRRGSEGEHGRRALAAGLTMHVLEGTTSSKGVRRKNSGDKRPISKNSRSDTHLPRLSRSHSRTSITSHSSNNSAKSKNKSRPDPVLRMKSDESVHVLDEEGFEAAEVDAEDEGWESGDGEVPALEQRTKSDSKVPQVQNGNGDNDDGGAMRRTKSDTHANTTKVKARQPNIKGVLSTDHLVESPLDAPQAQAHMQRTTGFAGAVQPNEPDVEAQLPHPDPHPITTPHPMKKSASARSLVGPITFEGLTKDGGLATEPPKAAAANEKKTRDPPSRLRSTDGSGLPALAHGQPGSSPSYPFPQMLPPTQHTKKATSPLAPKVNPSTSAAPDPAAVTAQAPMSTSPESDMSNLPEPSGSVSTTAPRARQASGPPGPSTLRHRYSNSSLRSIQSLRAPPHPLNSPTAYRVQQGSRSGSMFGSPSKNDGGRQRMPSMHQPPVPAPQVSYEVAQGQGWDGIPEEAEVARSTKASSSQHMRNGSLSSNRSLSGIFAGAGAGSANTKTSQPLSRTVSSASTSRQQQQNQSTSGGGGDGRRQVSRRRTAIEAASAASKMSTTTNAIEYHHSLGYSTNSAETCFLVSRFLPLKKIDRPKWEISNRELNDLYSQSNEQGDGYGQLYGGDGGGMRIGLTDGDYRQAHESLVRTLLSLDLNAPNGTMTNSNTSNNTSSAGVAAALGVNMSRSHSGYSVTPTQDKNVTTLGLLRNGGGKEKETLVVTKGGMGGKTPFELSVQRCLAQRPGRLAISKLEG